MRLKLSLAALALLSTPLLAAEPAAVTTYAESHPHPEYKFTYSANNITHAADDATYVIRKGQCLWFQADPTGDTQQARMEDGSIHTVTVADFFKVADIPTILPAKTAE